MKPEDVPLKSIERLKKHTFAIWTRPLVWTSPPMAYPRLHRLERIVRSSIGMKFTIAYPCEPRRSTDTVAIPPARGQDSSPAGLFRRRLLFSRIRCRMRSQGLYRKESAAVRLPRQRSSAEGVYPRPGAVSARGRA